MESVAILVIGDEILTGEISDENSSFLVRALNRVGVQVVRIVTVPDRQEAIVDELLRLRALADAVVVSGGIGPTHDDLTRPAVAEALGLELESNPEAEARVEGFYRDRATDAERAMARIPRGATLVDGEKTPTFGFQVGGIYALPGVPFLFRDIVRRLAREFAERPTYRTTLETRRREGEIAPRLAALQRDSLDVAIGSYPVCEKGRWHVRIVVRAADPARLEEVAEQVRQAIG